VPPPASTQPHKSASAGGRAPAAGAFAEAMAHELPCSPPAKVRAQAEFDDSVVAQAKLVEGRKKRVPVAAAATSTRKQPEPEPQPEPEAPPGLGGKASAAMHLYTKLLRSELAGLSRAQLEARALDNGVENSLPASTAELIEVLIKVETPLPPGMRAHDDDRASSINATASGQPLQHQLPTDPAVGSRQSMTLVPLSPKTPAPFFLRSPALAAVSPRLGAGAGMTFPVVAATTAHSLN
jgi:hypothetical protein